ncbi:MAG TPA: DNA repair protein RecN [Syntrophales bacterium]|nr:DNA repair protein RecN [Syntrophales bacterium]
MLKELNIRNLAVIDDLRVAFPEGLSIISGETGAGKSVIMEAVGLLQGDRASTDWIRSSEEAAVVEALFHVGDRPEILDRLEEMGFERSDEIIVKRILSRTGKNRAYVNDALSTLNALSVIGGALVNICSQHEHQNLLDAGRHLAMLDNYGGLGALKASYTALYDRDREIGERIAALEKRREERLRTEELLRFQQKEIADGKIQPGEDDALQEERTVLAHGRKLREMAEEAYAVLYSGEGDILEKLSTVMTRIRQIREIDRNAPLSPEQVEGAYYALQDAALLLRDYGKDILFDPARIEAIEERLEYLGRMKRKYGGTLSAVLKKKDDLEAELKGLLSAEEDLEAARKERSSLSPRLLDAAGELSERRKAAAKSLEKEIEDELRGLCMDNTRFRVVFHKAFAGRGDGLLLSPEGADEAEFYLSPNAGEEPKPLNRIASGGELSRITLAIRKVLAETSEVRTIVFDEVDAGIGGAAAEAVGKKLRDAASHHQVLCITHLPQIACFGENHFLVEKTVSDGRTKTAMRRLSEKERLEEVARMLGGARISDKAREHASEMLKSGRKQT